MIEDHTHTYICTKSHTTKVAHTSKDSYLADPPYVMMRMNCGCACFAYLIAYHRRHASTPMHH